MSQDSDFPVVVVPGRVDVELAITLWVSGYRAHRATEVDAVLDLTKDGGLVLLDARAPSCDDWIERLRTMGYPGPIVLLDGRVSSCVRTDDAAVRTPWNLDAMGAAFEAARELGESMLVEDRATSRELLFTAEASSESAPTETPPAGATVAPVEPRPKRIRRLV